ncbi:hypothetical protein MKW98_029642 [Papaver atlanticum]|uniref:Hydroxyproline-rich glycoprotein family protein n=1 Tax=Papaver atlanticum TaxID=357466 RepID=A0AAD4T6J3_9MAGN|nr:hypothetical protein MKW98_029642 [Papaver atlanticum]
MAEGEFGVTQAGKQVQKVSIPFLWEEKPGTPKKGWKRENVPATAGVPPLKLITSVPFEWEEEPGKPLACFASSPMIGEEPVEPLACVTPPPPPQLASPHLPLPPGKLIGFPSPLMHASMSSPVTIRSKLSNVFRRRGSYRGNDGSEYDDEEESGDEQEMFISSPSLIPNGLISTVPNFNPFPVDQAKVNAYSTSTEEDSEELDENTSTVSETESDLSSYATESTSLIGDSFLDSLFPVYSQDSGVLDKVGKHEKKSSVTFSDQKIIIGFQSKTDSSIFARRTLTLQQLIEMSRKLSCRRKEVQMSKRDIPMEFMKRSLFGCFIA